MATLDRRGFLTSTGMAMAGGFSLPALGKLAAAAPENSNTPHKYKFSLAAYSYRELLPNYRPAKPGTAPKPPAMTVEDFVSDCAKFGLEGTELTSYYFPPDVSADYLTSLKDFCRSKGLAVTGTAVGNDLTHPPGEVRDGQIALIKRWVDNAEVLGAPVIRIFSGNVKQGQTEAEAHRLAVEGIEECCDYAGKHGVKLALENHGGLTSTAAGLLKLVADVKSKWFGVNFDSGNFHSADPYAELEQIAPHAINAQIKVSISRGEGKSAKREQSDYKRLAKILRAAGYKGFIVLEYEEPGDPRKECPKILDELRAAFA